MKNNTLLINVLVIIVVGAAAFFGGMQYQKSNSQSLQPGNRIGQFSGAANGGGRFIRGFARQGMGPVSGKIISKDNSSVTVKLADGGSKIIVLSDTTKISKTQTATKDDLKTGESIVAFGKTNSDGSITAQNISMGNAMMFGGLRATPAPAK